MTGGAISKNTGKCNLCGNGEFEKVADRLRNTGEYKVYKCLSCGHVQVLPRPTLEDEKQFYNEDRQEKSVRPEVDLEIYRNNFKHDISRRAEFISKEFPKGTAIIDVGCGYGFFPKEMAGRGYDIRGIEISKERRGIAKTVTNAQIIEINLAEAPAPDNVEKAGLVTCFHVVEHMTDPVDFCRNLRGLVKEGGCLLVEVPNVNELMLETCPAYNEFYWDRAHLNYFSKKTLEDVLKKAGFSEVRTLYVQRYGIENLSSWLTTGKPQLKNPVFEISEPYKWLEDYYRIYLEKNGRTDTLFAVACVK